MLEFRISLDQTALSLSEYRQLSLQLQNWLERIEPSSLSRVIEASATPGSKGMAEIGALAVQVLPKILPKLIDALASWVGPRPERTIHLRLVSDGRDLDLTFSPDTLSPERLSEYLKKIETALPPAPAA